MSTAHQRSIPVVYVRGGTSRALVFRSGDLPACAIPGDFSPWNDVFLRALGSPDPSGRQLDGMGGGVSSLSKVAIVDHSSDPAADVDYTFAQVGIKDRQVSYKGNCGNISSAIGPFAVDEGLVRADGDEAVVRIRNTNTGKLIVARFAMAGGKAAVHGDYEFQGVAGNGAPVQLDFLEPGGAVTGKLFPTDRLHDRLSIPGLGVVPATMMDVANPVVFVAAQDLRMTGAETPDQIGADHHLMASLEAVRVAASLAMGVARSEDEARHVSANLPLVAIVAPVRDGADIGVRMISAGQPHRASPLTGAMCLAAAAHVTGTVVHAQLEGRTLQGGRLRVAHPGGVLDVASSVIDQGTDSQVRHTSVFRTARRLMDGRVYVDA